MKYKIIKVSEAVHKQLVEDKKHFSDVIGYRFRFTDVVNEYQKILRTIKSKQEVKKNVDNNK